MKTEELELDMSTRTFLDLTPQLRAFADGLGDGLINVFVPHATAGLALMEAGSGSEQDLEAAIDRLLPRDDRYVHAHGPPGHGADHVLPAFVAPSLVIPVLDGAPALGTWQSVVMVDTNRQNARRKVRFSFVPS